MNDWALSRQNGQYSLEIYQRPWWAVAVARCSWPLIEAAARWNWLWRIGWGHKDDPELLDHSLGSVIYGCGNWLAFFDDRHTRHECRVPISAKQAREIDDYFASFFDDEQEGATA